MVDAHDQLQESFPLEEALGTVGLRWRGPKQAQEGGTQAQAQGTQQAHEGDSQARGTRQAELRRHWQARGSQIRQAGKARTSVFTTSPMNRDRRDTAACATTLA